MNPIETYYALKFLRLLTQQWKDTDAYKMGIVDQNGKLVKPKSQFTTADRDAYSIFKRLVYNIKRALEKVPGMSSTIGRYTTAFALIREHLDEDAPTNNAGSSNISQPQLPLGAKREKFANVDVFEVDGAAFSRSQHGKPKYERWANYVDIEEEMGDAVRSFARANPKKPIILKHKDIGSMIYIRR